MESSNHLVATSRSSRELFDWGIDFTRVESEAGRKVIWAPCQALSGSVSLRSWILDRAARTLGESAPTDTSTLLSGAADTLVIHDPASADRESLAWLSGVLDCSREVEDIAKTPPMPRLAVLVQAATSGEPHVVEFLESLNLQGSTERRLSSNSGDLNDEQLDKAVKAARGRCDELLVSMSLVPCPLQTDEYDELAAKCGANHEFANELRSGDLFTAVGGLVVPVQKNVCARLQTIFGLREKAEGAQRVVATIQQRLEELPDAGIELLLTSGKRAEATDLARQRFDDHRLSGRFEEALAVMRLAERLDIAIDRGPNSRVIDEAIRAWLVAETGDHEGALEIGRKLGRKRRFYQVSEFVFWLSLAYARVAQETGKETRSADSLLRRAIRLSSIDVDRSVWLTLRRVALLRSDPFSLHERADWLLTHINNAMLDDVTDATKAAYLEELAARMVATGDFKGAFKRLRQVVSIASSDLQLARCLLLMARCRIAFEDFEAAERYATNALMYGLRSAGIGVVRESAEVLRELPTLVSSLPGGAKKFAGGLPLATQVLTPADQLFEILKSRFGVSFWARRRASTTTEFGKESGAEGIRPGLWTQAKDAVGEVVPTPEGARDGERALVLLRDDGSDLIVFAPPSGGESSVETIVRFLLADRRPKDELSAETAPRRQLVIEDYLARAKAIEDPYTVINARLEILFSRDLLIHLEENGYTKEEMANLLGISRATLYRMYSRAGLS